MPTDIEIAKRFLKDNDYSLVVVKDWVELVSSERGILPLLMIYDNCPEKLEGAVLADKVIGKAAAFILSETEVEEVYGEVMSRSALPVLQKAGIRYSYGKLVSEIMNRDGSDLCPMEKLCRDTDISLDGIMSITAFLCRNKQSGSGTGEQGCNNFKCN